MTQIRRATRADIPACAQIVHDWELSTGYLPQGPGVDGLSELIAEAFYAREIWVTGAPVDGYMSVDPVERKLGALYMTRTGQGLGKRFMEIAKRGRDFLWLTVYRPNTRARAFYAREGFTDASEVPGTAGQPDMIRMEWRA